MQVVRVEIHHADHPIAAGPRRVCSEAVVIMIITSRLRAVDEPHAGLLHQAPQVFNGARALGRGQRRLDAGRVSGGIFAVKVSVAIDDEHARLRVGRTCVSKEARRAGDNGNRPTNCPEEGTPVKSDGIIRPVLALCSEGLRLFVHRVAPLEKA